MNTLVIFKRQPFELQCRLTLMQTGKVLNQINWKSLHDPFAGPHRTWILWIHNLPVVEMEDHQESNFWALHIALMLRSADQKPRALCFRLALKRYTQNHTGEPILVAFRMHHSGLTIRHNG